MCGKNWPKEWDNIMGQDLKDYFIEEGIVIEDEMEDAVPEYFFTYCYDMFFEKYLDYKPFFTCFEKGEEVFKNFYKIYGQSYDLGEEKEKLGDVTDEQLKKILARYIDGLKYFKTLAKEEYKCEVETLQSWGDGLRDIAQMEIKRVTNKEFEEQYPALYDQDPYEDHYSIWEEIGDMLDEIVWPETEENFLTNFMEPLYQLLEDYNLIYYILWPIAKREDIENPFTPFVELNERGMEVYIADENTLVVVE